MRPRRRGDDARLALCSCLRLRASEALSEVVAPCERVQLARRLESRVAACSRRCVSLDMKEDSNYGLGAPRSLDEIRFIDPYGPVAERIDVFDEDSLNERWPCLVPMPEELEGSSRLVERSQKKEFNPTGAQFMVWRQNQVPVHRSADPKQVRTLCQQSALTSSHSGRASPVRCACLRQH